MLEWFNKHKKLSKNKAIQQIHLLLKSSPTAIKQLYNDGGKKKLQSLNKTDENYGDPYTSIISYFEFFESPLKDNNVDENEQDWFDNDWLIYSEIEAFTTKMDIKDNILLTENRLFNIEIKTYIKNETNVKVQGRELKLIDLKNFIIDITNSKIIDNISKSEINEISSKAKPVNKTYNKKNTSNKTRKLKECKYGERLSNGKCPLAPKKRN